MTGQLRYPAWRKSSYSSAASNCVEVALGSPAIRQGPRLQGPPRSGVSRPAPRWSAFLQGLAASDFDR